MTSPTPSDARSLPFSWQVARLQPFRPDRVGREARRRLRTDYQVEGEVRDAATLAIVRDAVVEVSTDVEGYGRRVPVDEAGRFVVVVNALVAKRRPLGAIEEIGGFKVTEELSVQRLRVRARAGARCSPTHSFGLGQIPFPSLRLQLLVNVPCESAERNLKSR